MEDATSEHIGAAAAQLTPPSPHSVLLHQNLQSYRASVESNNEDDNASLVFTSDDMELELRIGFCNFSVAGSAGKIKPAFATNDGRAQLRTSRPHIIPPIAKYERFTADSNVDIFAALMTRLSSERVIAQCDWMDMEDYIYRKQTQPLPNNAETGNVQFNEYRRTLGGGNRIAHFDYTSFNRSACFTSMLERGNDSLSLELELERIDHLVGGGTPVLNLEPYYDEVVAEGDNNVATGACQLEFPSRATIMYGAVSKDDSVVSKVGIFDAIFASPLVTVPDYHIELSHERKTKAHISTLPSSEVSEMITLCDADVILVRLKMRKSFFISLAHHNEIVAGIFRADQGMENVQPYWKVDMTLSWNERVWKEKRSNGSNARGSTSIGDANVDGLFKSVASELARSRKDKFLKMKTNGRGGGGGQGLTENGGGVDIQDEEHIVAPRYEIEVECINKALHLQQLSQMVETSDEVQLTSWLLEEMVTFTTSLIDGSDDNGYQHECIFAK